MVRLPRPTPRVSHALWWLPVLLLGGWLRCSQAGESLWLDELHTSWVVADGVRAIPGRAMAGNQSPVYFFLVWVSVSVFGHSEWALRLPSLLAGLALIGATAAVVRQWSGSCGSSLLAALLVAVNFDCVFFAQEARPYALVQLSAVGHAAVFASLIERPTPGRRVAFVAGAAWLFYLHYTAFLLLVAEGLCLAALLVWDSRRVAYRPGQFCLDAIWIGLLLAPASPHVAEIAARRGQWARIADAWHSPALRDALVTLVGVPLIVLLVGRACRVRRSAFRFASRHGLWSVCWFAVPASLAWASTLVGLAALWMPRYLVASLAGAIVFASLCHASFANRWYRCLAGTVMVLSLVISSGMIPQWWRDGRWVGERNEPWPAAIHWLADRHAAQPLPAFLCPALLEDQNLTDGGDPNLREYCLFPLRGIYRLDIPHVEPLATGARTALGERRVAAVGRQGGAWFLMRLSPQAGSRVVDQLTGELRRAGLAARVDGQRRFGGLLVVRLAVAGVGRPSGMHN